jgi:hypothetical protein
MEDGLLGGSSKMGRGGGGGGEEARGCGFIILFIKNEGFFTLVSPISQQGCALKKTGDVRTSPRKFGMF